MPSLPSTSSVSIPHIFLFLLCVLGGSCDSSAVGEETTTTTTTTAGAGKNENVATKHTTGDCGIYLAPSTIPFAGLGMYVGNRSFDVNDIVTDEDIIVPIVERDWHASHVSGKKIFLHDEYTWNADVFPGMEEEIDDMSEITVASGGVGAAANSYLSLVNVEDNYIKIGRGAGPKSPGLGASTIYHGRSFYATAPLTPGQEIFVSYGHNYFESRTKTYGYLPLPDDDYNAADSILNKALILTLYNQKFAYSDGTGDSDTSKTDDATSLSERLWNDLHSFLIGLKETFETSRILNAIPPNVSDVIAVLKTGGTAKQHVNRSVRELSWLEENGQCMDNIKVGNSTNPDAGRGAFATRFIPEGGLVAPAPLVHITDPEMLKMWLDRTEDENGETILDRQGRFTYQLLMNYCFGHTNSTLLLCPYGLLTSLINHSSKAGANTKIQWNDNMRHKEWLDSPIETWEKVYHSGLQIDFVATRDIEPDEEIFIDYGDEWQAAWEKHVASFVPPPDTYVPGYQLTDWVDQLELRTVNDRDYELDGVRMRCHWWYLRKRGILKPKGAENPYCRILKKLSGSGEDDTYLVELLTWTNSDEQSQYELGYKDKGRLVWGLPKDAFYFSDLPYTRDMHQDWAFRHPMMFPDEIFPDVWRNHEGEDRPW